MIEHFSPPAVPFPFPFWGQRRSGVDMTILAEIRREPSPIIEGIGDAGERRDFLDPVQIEAVRPPIYLDDPLLAGGGVGAFPPGDSSQMAAQDAAYERIGDQVAIYNAAARVRGQIRGIVAGLGLPLPPRAPAGDWMNLT
ncbi:MAG: hypothetical protein A2103_05745 [Gammaproteobacteria bacterium GWF2_41_13]|nr:MAG: hypothetical protein A2103_05745 [Gammaproteobacteria bacterium GWF2_41_13]